METNTNSMNAFGKWITESITMKLLTILGLIIILLIPTFLLLDLVHERKNRQEGVIQEIGNSWSSSQKISGPILVLPYKTLVKVRGVDTEVIEERMAYAYILPDKIDFKAHVDTEIRSRGIYNASVYQTDFHASGTFGAIDFAKLNLDPNQIQLDKIRILVGLGDLKGIQKNPTIRVGDHVFETEIGHAEIHLFDQNLIFETPLRTLQEGEIPFSFHLNLKGSEALEFSHLAKKSTIYMDGNWESPKFSGEFLPKTHKIEKTGFQAHWEILQYSRNLPQQWTSQQSEVDMTKNKTFKVEFIQATDQYQKTERSIKYAILIIALTFVSLFFSEMMTKKSVPIFQYVLIGAAMIIFYSLLLSISEHIHFNYAYGISAIATITLIGIFISKLLGNFKVSLVFISILSVFYLFIFITLQLEDFALLIGSLGLFVTIAFLMYFSSRINWNKNI